MIETDIALRPATLADAERIAALFTDEGYPVGASVIEKRLERFSTEDSTVIVADHGGEILGLHRPPRGAPLRARRDDPRGSSPWWSTRPCASGGSGGS